MKLAFDRVLSKKATLSGNASSLGLVLLHGLVGSKRNWRGVVQQLTTDPAADTTKEGSPLSLECISVDWRNHGESPHHGEHSNEFMAQDLDGFLSSSTTVHSPNLPLVLMGHSMGGTALMHYLVTRHRQKSGLPPNIKGAIIVESAPCARPATFYNIHNVIAKMADMPFDPTIGRTSIHTLKQAEAWMKTTMKECQVNPDTNLIQYLLANLKAVEIRQPSASIKKGSQQEKQGDAQYMEEIMGHHDVHHQRRYEWRCNLPAIIQGKDGMLWEPSENAPGERVAIPTLFIFGTISDYYTETALKSIPAFFSEKTTEIQTIADVGHFPHFQRPSEFTSIVKKFLKSI